MPVMLAQNNTLLAVSKNRKTAAKYLKHRYSNSNVTMVRDPDKRYILRIYVSSDEIMREFQLYYMSNWRLYDKALSKNYRGEIGMVNDK